MKLKIKILVIDDSILFREVLARGLGFDDQISVVAKAGDPFEARDKILQFKPDVITCDVEMPKMSGIEFIKRLMPQYPVPVIVVSTVSNAVFDAMNAGAVGFVTKPDSKSADAINHFISDLAKKIKEVHGARVRQSIEKIGKIDYKMKADNKKIIAIGASTGGTQALSSLILSLPYNMPGIVIVQHIPPRFSKMFADRLNSQSHFNITEAENGMYVKPNHVYIAPGDRHMFIRKIGDYYKIELFISDKVSGHCPSVDVLFKSVAKSCGKNAIGVILTGMGHDGAKGLLQMRRNGARTIGQDQASSVVYGMPKIAYEVGGVERQLPLKIIPMALCSLLK
jgi:two-component system chemotaxis response regulator CheB